MYSYMMNTLRAMNRLNLFLNFMDKSLIVEMYPLDKKFQTKIEKEIGNLNEYEYIKFWE